MLCVGTPPAVYFRTEGTPPTRAGVLRTANDSIIVYLSSPGSTYSGWTLDESVAGKDRVHHSFGSQETDRVSVSGVQQLHPHLVQASGDRCDLTTYDVASVQTPAKDTVFIMPRGDNTSFSIDSIPLYNFVSLKDVYAYEDRNDAFHLNGRLMIGKVGTDTTVDTRLTGNSYAVYSDKGVPFHILPANLQQSEPYTFTLHNLNCANRQCSVNGDLSFPRQNGAPQDQPLHVALGTNGHATFTSDNTSSCVNPDLPPISQLCGLSADVDFQHPSVSVSGTASVGNQTWTVRSLGFTRLASCVNGIACITPRGSFATSNLSLGNALLLRSIQATFLPDGRQAEITADALVHLSVNSSNGNVRNLDASAELNGVVVHLPLNTMDLSHAQIDFSHAQVVPGQDSIVFNHALEACKTQSAPPPGIDPAHTFCLGVHLNTGLSRAPDDVAYGYLTLGAQSNDPYPVEALAVQLPSAHDAPFRIGLGTFGVSAFEVRLAHPPSLTADAKSWVDPPLAAAPAFADAFPTDKPSWMQTECSDIRLLADITIDSYAVNGATQNIASQPTVGFGPNCTVFDLEGGLPLQFSSQSNVQISSLVIAHVTDHGQQLNYVRASGSFTSGNITMFFDSLGYRSLQDRTDFCEPGHDEHQLQDLGARGCLIWRPNIPMSLGVTAVRNGPAIEKAIQNAIYAIGGFLLHGAHLSL